MLARLHRLLHGPPVGRKPAPPHVLTTLAERCLRTKLRVEGSSGAVFFAPSLLPPPWREAKTDTRVSADATLGSPLPTDRLIVRLRPSFGEPDRDDEPGEEGDEGGSHAVAPFVDAAVDARVHFSDSPVDLGDRRSC